MPPSEDDGLLVTLPTEADQLVLAVSKRSTGALATRLLNQLTKRLSAAQSLVVLKQLGKVVDVATKAAVDLAFDQVEREEMVLGATVSRVPLPAEYDYHDDPVLTTLDEKKKSVAKSVKERQAFLERIPGHDVADPTTGEVSTEYFIEEEVEVGGKMVKTKTYRASRLSDGNASTLKVELPK